MFGEDNIDYFSQVMGPSLIRFATASDLPSLVSIYNEAIRSGIATAHLRETNLEERAHWFRQFHPDRDPLYVMERQNTIVGYAYLSPYRPGREALSKVAEVSFYVARNLQRQGIGTDLLNHCIQEAKRLKMHALLAFLLELNQPSARLLSRLGFEAWGCFPDIVKLNGQTCSHLIYGLTLPS